MKPHAMREDVSFWVVVDPRNGWPLNWTMQQIRSESQQAIVKWCAKSPGWVDFRSWPELRKQGYRCVRVRLAPVKK